jgi:hypothetical protein
LGVGFQFPSSTGSATFGGEAGELTFSTLVKSGNGTYTLSIAAGMKRHFDATGLLVSRVDPLGNTRSYAYAAGKILIITDHAGLLSETVLGQASLRALCTQDRPRRRGSLNAWPAQTTTSLGFRAIAASASVR